MDDYKNENPFEQEHQEEHATTFSAQDHGYSGGEQDYDFYASFSQPESPRPHKNNNGLKIFAVVTCVVLVLTLLVFTGYVVYKERESALISSEGAESEDALLSHVEVEIQSTPSSVSNSEQQEITGEMSTEDIAEKVLPSIVGIVVYTQDSAENAIEYGSGSGIVLTSDGYIVTNAHVILQENTTAGKTTPVDKVDVYLYNGEVCSAKIVGADTRTDLAVLKISKQNLVAAEFGDSTVLKVGEKAVAIGNPTGLTLASSVTQGIISGVNRNITVGTSSYTMNCIQTDAAINPGNSGGALVNKYGQVVGINSSKIAQTEYEGIGFAIPMDEAKPIIDNLIADGYVTDRVRIGITFTSIPGSMGDLLGVPAGLRVISVDESTDAYKKGVAAGDIITELDGISVVELSDVSAILEKKTPGDEVKLTIYRERNGKKTLTVTVVLQEDTTGKLN